MRRVLLVALAIVSLVACGDRAPLRLRGEATATATGGSVRSITLTGHGPHLRVRVLRNPSQRDSAVHLGLLSPLPGHVATVHLVYGPSPYPRSKYWLRPVLVHGDDATFDVPAALLGDLKLPFRFVAGAAHGSFPGNGP